MTWITGGGSWAAGTTGAVDDGIDKGTDAIMGTIAAVVLFYLFIWCSPWLRLAGEELAFLFGGC